MSAERTVRPRPDLGVQTLPAVIVDSDGDTWERGADGLYYIATIGYFNLRGVSGRKGTPLADIETLTERGLDI